VSRTHCSHSRPGYDPRHHGIIPLKEEPDQRLASCNLFRSRHPIRGEGENSITRFCFSPSTSLARCTLALSARLLELLAPGGSPKDDRNHATNPPYNPVNQVEHEASTKAIRLSALEREEKSQESGCSCLTLPVYFRLVWPGSRHNRQSALTCGTLFRPLALLALKSPYPPLLRPSFPLNPPSPIPLVEKATLFFPRQLLAPNSASWRPNCCPRWPPRTFNPSQSRAHRRACDTCLRALAGTPL
jgi:hypothetical protein